MSSDKQFADKCLYGDYPQDTRFYLRIVAVRICELRIDNFILSLLQNSSVEYPTDICNTDGMKLTVKLCTQSIRMVVAGRRVLYA